MTKEEGIEYGLLIVAYLGFLAGVLPLLSNL